MDTGYEHVGGWTGDEYAAQADHHRAVDEWFLERHPPRPADHIVDAGCGDGAFTARLAGLVPDGHVVGVEPDPSMLAAARPRAGGNLEFRPGRLQQLDDACEPASADLVVSRAAFHWIPLAEHPRCYAAIRRVLSPGGWLHAESGGAGNVPAVGALLDDVADRHGLGPRAVVFPDAGTALEQVEAAGFDVPDGGVRTVAQRRAFDRGSLVGFLRTQAVLAYAADADEQTRRTFASAAVDRLAELRRHDGSWDQTFVRLDVLAQRPG